MRIHFLFPVLPPSLDGIGDYTACLAKTIGRDHEVKVLTGVGSHHPIERVCLETVIGADQGSFVAGLCEAVIRDQPDWLIIQYNPFSYGRWGYCASLPVAVHIIRKRARGTKIALMVHEPFVPVRSFKTLVMTSWQRLQFLMLGHDADVLLFAIEPWVRKFSKWFPTKPARHLPVGANIPAVSISRNDARKQIEVNAKSFLVGVFGRAHPSRLLNYVRAAAEAMAAEVDHLLMIYIGSDGSQVRDALRATPLLDVGPLQAHEVSIRFAAMDLYLAPFRKGVSTRRGSFMAGLQQGVPTISTIGSHTDNLLRERNGSAFVLAPEHDMNAFARCAARLASDPQRREQIARAGRELYDDNFSWTSIASTLMDIIDVTDESKPPASRRVDVGISK